MRWLKKIRATGADLLVAWYALRDPATPRPAKLLLVLFAIYVVSPLDLVPDGFPILGWLDDAALLLLGLPAALRLLPVRVQASARQKAARWRLRLFDRWQGRH